VGRVAGDGCLSFFGRLGFENCSDKHSDLARVELKDQGVGLWHEGRRLRDAHATWLRILHGAG
jgi:hypothetical protein